MTEAAHHAGGGHQRCAHEHVAQVGDGGIGQAALEVLLLQGHGGAEQDGEAAQPQHDQLHHGAGQELRAEHVVDGAQYGIRAGVDHRHGMQQGGDGRGGHGGRGQPGIHGEHRSLGAEADECQQEHAPQQLLMPGELLRIQDAAQGEVSARAVHQREHQRHKGHGRAADGEVQVLAPRADGGRVLLVGDQGQGDQGQALVEDVEGEQVRRHGDGQGDAVGHGVEGEEGVGPLLMGHVLKAVEGGQGPQERHQSGEHAAHAVQAEHQVQLGAHAQAHQGVEPVGAVQQQAQHHQRCGDHHRLHVDAPALHRAETEQRKQCAAQKRHKQRQENQHRASSFLTSGLRPARPAVRSAPAGTCPAKPTAPSAQSAGSASASWARTWQTCGDCPPRQPRGRRHG